MFRSTLLTTAAMIMMATGSGCCGFSDAFSYGSACGGSGAIGCNSCGGGGCNSCERGGSSCDSGCNNCNRGDCGGCRGRRFLLLDFLQSEWGCFNCSSLGFGCCGDDCGETYRGDYLSDPPARCEPCDRHGQWIGPSTYRRHQSHGVSPVVHESVIEGEVIDGPTLAPSVPPVINTTPSPTAPQWKPRSSQP